MNILANRLARSAPRTDWRRMVTSDGMFGFLLTLPALVILIAVFVYPLFFSFLTSFQRYDVSRPADARFIGLENYLATLRNPDFQRALGNSLRYVLTAIPIEFILGLIIAMALSNITRGRGFFRAVLVIPMMLAPVTIGLMWKFMYNDQLGVISAFIRQLGMRPPLWLSDPALALNSVIAVEVWATVPIFVLLLLAGLLGISQDYYEAARIDGATTRQTFRWVTLPLLRPIILIAVLIRGMDAFRVFDIIYTMTSGGPALRSDVVSYYIYRTAFMRREFGEATASAWIVLAILLLGAGILLMLNRRAERT